MKNTEKIQLTKLKHPVSWTSSVANHIYSRSLQRRGLEEKKVIEKIMFKL